MRKWHRNTGLASGRSIGVDTLTTDPEIKGLNSKPHWHYEKMAKINSVFDQELYHRGRDLG